VLAAVTRPGVDMSDSERGRRLGRRQANLAAQSIEVVEEDEDGAGPFALPGLGKHSVISEILHLRNF